MNINRRSLLKGASALCVAQIAPTRGAYAVEGLYGANKLAPISISSSSSDMMVVRPVDHGEALLNPNMGWNYPYFADNKDHSYGGSRPIDDTLDWFPGATAAYFRIGWAHLEPEEGKFNWSYTDRVADRWIAKGKQVAYSWIIFSTAGSMPATPLWLKDRGAKGWIFPTTNSEPIPQWIPNWDDPVFLEKFGNFLAAASERYDGKSFVQFIEIGSLGTWGEGHTYTGNPTVKIPPITLKIQKTHLDLWRRNFKNTTLLVNDDYDTSDGNPAGANPFEPHVHAVEYASSIGYGLIDCSIMVQDARPFLSAWLATPIWPKQPIGLETEQYGPAYRVNKTWHDGSDLLDAMERYHASFLRIHWWPNEFLNGNGKDLPGNWELVKRINQRIGYRLQVMKATWPRRVRSGVLLNCSISLRNAGVAPCYNGGFLSVSLIDSNGQLLVHAVDKTFDVKNLAVGPSVEQAAIVDRTISLQVPNSLMGGDYNICVSIEGRDGLSRYRLPFTEFDDQGRYRIGNVAIYR